MGYISAENIRSQFDPREVRGVCTGYDPEFQVVFITEIIHGGRAKDVMKDDTCQIEGRASSASPR
jgi:hypothetical protein